MAQFVLAEDSVVGLVFAEEMRMKLLLVAVGFACVSRVFQAVSVPSEVDCL